VRALFENGWLHLFTLDETGCMAWRYAGNLQWAAMHELRGHRRRSPSTSRSQSVTRQPYMANSDRELRP